MASIPDVWRGAAAQLAADEAEPRPAIEADRASGHEGGSTRRGETAGAALVDPPVARAVRGDEAVLAELYAAHAPAIVRFLADLLGDRAAAADGTQETFVRAFRRLPTLRAADRAAPWLFGIARNVALEHQRARRRRGRVLVPEASDGAPPHEAPDHRTPEAELLGREAARVTEAALGRLSEDRRTMLLLRLDHHLAYEEIAELMGFSLAKVKVEIHRARQILRAALDAHGGDTP